MKNCDDLKEFVLKRIKQQRQVFDTNAISGYIDAYLLKQEQVYFFLCWTLCDFVVSFTFMRIYRHSKTRHMNHSKCCSLHPLVSVGHRLYMGQFYWSTSEFPHPPWILLLFYCILTPGRLSCHQNTLISAVGYSIYQHCRILVYIGRLVWHKILTTCNPYIKRK